MKLHHLTPLLIFGTLLSAFAQSPLDPQKSDAPSFPQRIAKPVGGMPSAKPSPTRRGQVEYPGGSQLERTTDTSPASYQYYLSLLELWEEEFTAKKAEVEAGYTPASALMPLHRERLRLVEQVKASKPLPEFTVQPGTLEAALKQLEEHIGEDAPTLLFGTGVKDLKVPAPLRLKNARIVDALALIAASAGCNLEPIYPPGGGLASGYRFAQASSTVDTFDPTISGAPHGHVGVSLMKKDENIAISQVRPGSPAAKGGVQEGDLLLAVEDESRLGVEVRNLPIEEVAKLIRGTPGSEVRLTLLAPGAKESDKRVVSLLREIPVLPVGSVVQVDPVPRTTGRAGTTSRSPARIMVNPLASMFGGTSAPADFGGTPVAPAPAAVPIQAATHDPSAGPVQWLSTDPFVKIYALGSVLKEQDMQEKQNSLGELITAAFQTAGLNAPVPPQVPGGKPEPKEAATLHFHPQSRALIVKATPKEHEIIQQVLDVLREDARAQSLVPSRGMGMPQSSEKEPAKRTERQEPAKKTNE